MFWNQPDSTTICFRPVWIPAARFLRRSIGKNEAYQEEKTRFDDLAEEIREKLGKDERLYFRLEESFNRLKAMDEEWVYRAGFGGCMQVLRWMETILE